MQSAYIISILNIFKLLNWNFSMAMAKKFAFHIDFIMQKHRTRTLLHWWRINLVKIFPHGHWIHLKRVISFQGVRVDKSSEMFRVPSIQFTISTFCQPFWLCDFKMLTNDSHSKLLPSVCVCSVIWLNINTNFILFPVTNLNRSKLSNIT